MKVIKENQTLTSRSTCDYNCIFSIFVISRKGNFATIQIEGATKRTKIYTDREGNEYLMPEKYSMAPIYRAQ